MIIDIEEDLSKLSVYVERNEFSTTRIDDDYPIKVWETENPVLLTDVAEICKLDSPLRETVLSLYQSYPRTVRYDGIETSWDPIDYPKVWCPNIDSVWMAKKISETVDNQPAKIAEMGTGSGFLTKFMVNKFAPEQAYYTDISPAAISCANDNFVGFETKTKLNPVLVKENQLGLETNNSFDLIVCNPPYIPSPEHLANPYQGIKLIESFVDQVPNLLNNQGIAIMNVSSVGGPQVLDLFADYELLGEFRVPLKIYALINEITEESKRWLEYLDSIGTLDVEENNSDYKYWHTLKLFAYQA